VVGRIVLKLVFNLWVVRMQTDRSGRIWAIGMWYDVLMEHWFLNKSKCL
jgi:hypothetical protein